jgi:hypothetical protein
MIKEHIRTIEPLVKQFGVESHVVAMNEIITHIQITEHANYEVTYQISVDGICEMDKKYFSAHDNEQAKITARKILKSDSRYRLGDYWLLHKIVKEEVR